MSILENSFALAVYFGVVLGARLIPFVWSRAYGIDNWYWKLYLEEYRRTGRIPVTLPYYLLEHQEQWYPPLFPWLVGKLPEKVEERAGWLVAPVLDALTGVLIAGYVHFVFGMVAASVTALVYALSPVLEDYNVQLNPRTLGNLLYTALMLLLLQRNLPLPAVVFAAGLLLGLIALLHKMTLQLTLFSLLLLSPFVGWKTASLVFLAGLAMAFLLSGGFYWKVLLAHWDIVTFWNRNWRWLNAHQYYDSPLYAHLRSTEYRDARLHREGVRGVLHHLKLLAGMLPASLCLFAALAIVRGDVFPESRSAFWAWFFAVESFALLTTFVPQLKCLGAGILYQFNAAVPTALLAGMLVAPGFSIWSVGAALCNGMGFLWVLRRLRQKARAGQNSFTQDLSAMFDVLRAKPDGPVWCIPLHICDAAAYFSRKPIMWGGHSFGFSILEPVFPVLRISLEEVFRRFHVRYLVVDKRYVPELMRHFAEQIGQPVFECGHYALWEREPS